VAGLAHESQDTTTGINKKHPNTFAFHFGLELPDNTGTARASGRRLP
jgi:hypothetical protein